MNWFDIRCGDALTLLRAMPNESVQCVVTSPPYFGLRNYKMAGQTGLEKDPAVYISALVAVFSEIRRVLAKRGTLWINCGDSYAGSWGNQGRKETRGGQRPVNGPMMQNLRPYPNEVNTGTIPKDSGLKPKDLIGIPWSLAFALRADGYYLRSDIIWSKSNAMPSSILDRPTTAHEYLFLLSKSARYYYDTDAIREPQAVGWNGSSFNDKRDVELHPDVGKKPRKALALVGSHGTIGNDGNGMRMPEKWNNPLGRNKRSVWTIATQPCPVEHFAAFPEDLVRPCILAGSRVGDTILDPFSGSGTTGAVAIGLQRNFIGLELNPDYCEMAKRRIGAVAPLFSELTTITGGAA